MNKKPVVKVDRMHILDGEGPTKAFCDLLILDTFLVKGLRVVNGPENLFVSMPQERSKDGNWYDTFFPLSKQMRKGLSELILSEYAQIVEA